MRLVPTMLLAGFCLLVATLDTGTAFAKGDPLAADSLRALELMDRGQIDSVRAMLRADVVSARARGDSTSVGRALILEVGAEIQNGNVKPVWPKLEECMRLAQSMHDTLLLKRTLRQQGIGYFWLGDKAAALKSAEACLALAIPTRDLYLQGESRILMASIAYQAGDYERARGLLTFAVAAAETLGNLRQLANATNSLGNIDLQQGRYAEARTHFTRVFELGRQIPSTRFQAFALNNMGFVEGRMGDPAKALSDYQQSGEIHRQRHSIPDALTALDNVVLQQQLLGRMTEAEKNAREALAEALDNGLGEEVPWQKQALADVLWLSGRHGEATRLYREVLATGDSAGIDPRSMCVIGLARALADRDSVPAALAVLATFGPHAKEQPSQEALAQMRLLESDLLVRAGQSQKALAVVREWAPKLEASGDAEYALAAWTQVAALDRSLGLHAEAERDLAHAAAVWEANRRKTHDAEYRELRGEQGRRLAIETVLQSLAAHPGDPAAAFDRMQRFKTRTLLERMAGPLAFGDHAPAWLDAPWQGLAHFQRDVLKPGELLLEYVVGRDTSVVFAVTREQCEAFPLEGEQRLGVAVDLVHDAFASAEWRAASSGPEAMERELGRRLLGPVAVPIAAATRVMIAPDGRLHRVPFAALIAPGQAAPLAATRQVVMAPSAGVLAQLRAAAPGSGKGLLALVSASRPGEPALAGAKQEADALASRYRNVTVWRAPGELPKLADFAGLHFAGHAIADDQTPWRSGFLIGRASGGGDSLLSAGDVAAGRLSARLVVLSSCQSAGTRIRSGEGVAGLANAFLAAGAPAVVATLWPVDDASSANLMHTFYAQLHDGKPAAEALQAAQAKLRADPATQAPFFWAGYILAGDGSVTLPLQRRSSAPYSGGVAAIVVILAAESQRRRRGRRAAEAKPGA